MERRFDATLKSLLEDAPEDWPRLLGIAAHHVQIIDADVSTVSGAADKILRLSGPTEFILHLEFQSGPDASIPCQTNMYNGVLEKRHDLPVRSVLILLRPEADLAVIDGEYSRKLPGGSEPYRIFRYDVVRVWQLPVNALLSGGLGTLPLAPISDVTAAEVPEVLSRMKRRLAKHPDRGRVGRLWTAVYVLLGLRYEQALAEQLLQGVLGMKESVTYQAIVAEGELKGRTEGLREGARNELRKVLLSQGEERFGPIPAWASPALEKIDSLEQLETMAKQVLRVRTWTELIPSTAESNAQEERGSLTLRRDWLASRFHYLIRLELSKFSEPAGSACVYLMCGFYGMVCFLQSREMAMYARGLNSFREWVRRCGRAPVLLSIEGAHHF